MPEMSVESHWEGSPSGLLRLAPLVQLIGEINGAPSKAVSPAAIIIQSTGGTNLLLQPVCIGQQVATSRPSVPLFSALISGLCDGFVVQVDDDGSSCPRRDVSFIMR